jgi:hypothetical protein
MSADLEAQMPVSVVRNLGSRKQATLPNGRVVERQDNLQLTDGRYPCLQSETHFLYTTTHFGSKIMCSCGMNGVLVGYHAYKEFSSYIGNEVIMCHHYLTKGCHADGSH